MSTMGRKPTKNLNLPDRMHAVTNRLKVTYYYYDTGGKPRYLPLGKDYLEAVRKWAELERRGNNTGALLTLKDVIDKYRIDVIPEKAPRTQKDNEAEIAKLLEFFGGDARLAQIKPIHVRQYREWRPAKVRANREIALFSHIWNMAREWGATDLPNPCEGVKRNKEAGRDVYISDAEMAAVLKHAEPVLADAVELAYLTGQRPADVLKLRETDIRDGCIEIQQGKTGTKLRLNISSQLAAVLARCKARKSGTIYNTALITGAQGKPVSVQWISVLWRRARDAAGITTGIQFRDLRAKAVSDIEDVRDIRQAQTVAGHTTVTMTEHYSRNRRGKKVDPTR